jgi:hypothetical protein
MPKQFVMKATRSPLSFLAVCFALWFAAHSLFAALFAGFIVLLWIRKSIRDVLRAEPDASDAKAPPGTAPQPKVEESPTATVTPMKRKRQYAKSPVVAPLKTGTDDRSLRL